MTKNKIAMHCYCVLI